MIEIEKGCFLRLFNRGGYVLKFAMDFPYAFKSSADIASGVDNTSRREITYCSCRERRPFKFPLKPL